MWINFCLCFYVLILVWFLDNKIFGIVRFLNLCGCVYCGNFNNLFENELFWCDCLLFKIFGISLIIVLVMVIVGNFLFVKI